MRKASYLGVLGDDEQHLKGASAGLYTNSLLSKENLNLFYITLQGLFPDSQSFAPPVREHAQ